MGNPFEGLFDSGDVLERVGIDITAQARRGGLEPVRCRDAEIARVVDILLRQGKNNAALVGKAGVGKTAVVEGLANASPSATSRPRSRMRGFWDWIMCLCWQARPSGASTRT